MAYRKEIAIILLMAVLVAGVWMLVSRVDTAHNDAESRYVYDAIHNAALTCYAVEGAYPESLEYLRKNYGLAYDQSRYYVTYDAFASNQMPEIYVTEDVSGS